MQIQLSDHFTYRKLIRFVIPSVVMMIFTSIYGVVDGIFVSNFVGKSPFAAINFIMPFLMIFSTFGFMIGTGGSALVSKSMGEGEHEKANRIFSFLIYVNIAGGLLCTVIGLIFLRPVAVLLGAEGEMIEHCVVYGRIILISMVAFMLQNAFQSFLVAAGKPQFGLAVTVAAGVTNIVLDALFVAGFRWGLVGAAVATSISQCVGGIIPLVYFMLPNKGNLHLMFPVRFDGSALFKTITNGSSELMTNLSMSLVSMLYNYQLMRFAGEDGIAAYGVIMYVNFIFCSVFIGYSIGSAPLISYHFGAQNREELKGLLKKSLLILAVSGVVLTGLAELFALPLAKIFVGYDQGLMEMTLRGFMIYSLAFLVMGFNIFGSSFFTALNNGPVSALISFMRTLVFQVLAVVFLPMLWKLDGIWLSIIAAELLALLLTWVCLVKNRKKYGYM